MERYYRVGYIKTAAVLMLISLSMVLLATGSVFAAPQYSIGCSSCHGMPPLDAASGKDPNTGAVAGNHQTHSINKSAACNKCHGNSGYSTGHRDGVVQFKSNINSSPATAQYRNGAFVNHTSMPILGSCSNVNCHFETTTPNWGSTAPFTCSSCHGAAPSSGSHPAAGNKHGNYLGTDTTSCVKCHPNHASFTHASSAGKRGITVQFSTAPNSGGTYTGGSTAYPNYLPSQSPAHNGTCSNLYCHSDGKGGPAATIPTWGSTLPVNCSGCHGSKDVNAATLSGAHNKHLNDTAGGGKFNCIDCHKRAVAKAAFPYANMTTHVNGSVDFGGDNAGNSKNCSNIYCHSNGKGAYAAIPAWTGTNALGCDFCHASGNLQSSHQKHLAKYSNTACNLCHNDTTTNGTQITGSAHINNQVDLKNGGTVTFTFNAGTCSSISCHGGGSATWGSVLNCEGCHTKASLTGAHLVHMGAINVATQVTFYNYTANLSPATSDATWQYGFGCASCHPLSVASHMNGSADVSLGNVAGAGSLKAKNGAAVAYNADKSCSQVYCHGDGLNTPSSTTPVWTAHFTGDRCASCHGNSPTTNAHALHVVGIHSDDIYNGTSGKLAAGASGNVSHGVDARATTLNCNICHVNTVANSANDKNSVCAACHDGVKAGLKGNASIAKLAFHVNGRVDVAFKPVKVVSKAQVRPASFNSYTTVWSRKAGAYKNYSGAYDTARNALNTATMWTPGAQQGQGSCANVSCHVGNTVQWNATLTCDSCHTRL